MGHEFEPLSAKIIEAAIQVHRELGPGFLESIYESALRASLRHRGITYESQKEVVEMFEGEEVACHRLDLVVEQEIIVELKAVKGLEDIHFAQLLSYLKATKLRVGLLLNFYSPTLVVKRVVHDEAAQNARKKITDVTDLNDMLLKRKTFYRENAKGPKHIINGERRHFHVATLLPEPRTKPTGLALGCFHTNSCFRPFAFS